VLRARFRPAAALREVGQFRDTLMVFEQQGKLSGRQQSERP